MKKFSLFAVLAMLLAMTFAIPTTIASPDRGTIAANCRVAQSTLNRIEKADAVSRINRGREYNEMLNLMFAMNARLANNKIAAPELTRITSDLNQRLTDFRNNYNRYDNGLERVVGLDCVAKPVEFYEKLESVRTDRGALAGDVFEMAQLMDQYESELGRIVGGQQ